MSYQVKELLLPDGSRPYAAWFSTLDPMAAAKVSVAAARMEQGNLSNVEWFRGIGEYKIDWGPGYRIYLAKDARMPRELFEAGYPRLPEFLPYRDPGISSGLSRRLMGS